MTVFVILSVIAFLLILLAILLCFVSIIGHCFYISEYLECCKNALFDIAEQLDRLQQLKETELLDNLNSKQWEEVAKREREIEILFSEEPDEEEV